MLVSVTGTSAFHFQKLFADAGASHFSKSGAGASAGTATDQF